MKPSKSPARRPARMRVTVLRECPVSVVARPSSELGPDGSTRVLPLTSASITDICTPVSQDRPLFWPAARCFRRENGPDRVSFCLALLPAAPGEEGHRVLDGDPRVPTVPSDQSLWIHRLEKDASDARHAGSTRSCDHARGGAVRI